MSKKLIPALLFTVLMAACAPVRVPAPPTAAPIAEPTTMTTTEPTAENAPVAPPPTKPAPSTLSDFAGLQRLRPLDFAPFESALAALTPERAAAVEAIVKDASIPQVQEAMKAGNLTAEELTLYFLSRIKQYDETLRHFLELNPAALDEARASDARRKDGKLIGPLDGIPINLKDNIETAGPMHTTGGSQILLNNVPAGDAPLVKSLRDAGAVILGKANLSEFAGGISALPGATAVGGLTINPHNPNFTAGGSSSGSGASVAAYDTFASVGSETAGSLIAPSSWNGVVGMYPGKGVVDGNGVIPLFTSNDSAGPIGRSVTDVALLLGAIDTTDTDYAAGLNADALKNTKVGLLKADILTAPTSPFEDTSDNLQVVRRIETGLTSAGATISEAVVDAAQRQQISTILGFLVNGGIRHDMLPYLVAAGAPVTDAASLLAYNAADPGTRIPFGQGVLEAAIQDTTLANKADFDDGVKQGQPLAAATLDAAFAASGADVLVSVNNYHSGMYATANYPAVSVPLGLRANGMPVGVTFIGKPGSEAKLLAYAFAFEQVTKARVNPDVAKTVAYVNAPARAFTYGDSWQAVSCQELGVTPEVAAQSDCGYVTVPEKRGESGMALGDKMIQLGVVRVRSNSKMPDAPIVKGEGGPGGPGLLYPTAAGLPLLQLYSSVLANHDMVFFTQRGTKGAKPELYCEAFDAVQYEAALKGWTQEEKEAQYAATTQQCTDEATSKGIDLSAYNTNENADDVNAIREALGYDKINYYGVSYGTLLGQYVMRRHPDILEAVILDGIVPAEITQYSQIVDIQKSFKRVFAACAADEACNAAYPDLENVFNSAMADLKANPAPVEITQADGTTATLKVDHLAAIGGLFLKIYQGGADVPATIYQLKDRDYTTLSALAPTPGGGTAKLMHFAVNCADDPNTSMDQFKLDTVPEPYRDFVEDDGATEVLACKVLKVPQLPDSSDVPVKSDLPALLLNGGLDPATDAEYGRVIAAGLPNSQYVLFPGNGHGQAQNACAVSIIAAFLKDPSATVDTTCIPPKPVFALPVNAGIVSADGAVSIRTRLPGNYIPSGTPGSYGAGKSLVAFKSYPAGTSIEEAISTTLAPTGIKFDPAQLVDGPVIGGLPSKVFTATAPLAGDVYDVATFAIVHPKATFVIEFLQGDAALQKVWREQVVPGYLKNVVISE